MKIKNILIMILALVVSVVAVGMMMQLFRLAFSLIFNAAILVTIVVVALPIYVIMKKKFFRR